MVEFFLIILALSKSPVCDAAQHEAFFPQCHLHSLSKSILGTPNSHRLIESLGEGVKS